MAGGFRGLLAFWIGGAAPGGAAEPVVTGGADYAVQSQGRGRKRRYFIEQDGRRLYGTRVELERLLERRAGTPPAARPAVPPPAPEPAPMAAQSAIAEPDLRPVDLSGIEATAAKLRRQYEDAVIALLLLN